MAIIDKSPCRARNSPKTIIYGNNYTSLFNEDINIEIYYNIYKIYEMLLNFIKNILKSEDSLNKKYGTSIVSFKLHLLLISIIVILNKHDYNIEDLIKINLNIKEEVFIKALDILEKILAQSTEINKLYYAKTRQIDEDIKNYKYY